MRGKLAVGVCLILVGLGAVAWFGRHDAMARYYVYKLTTSPDDSWIGRATVWGDGVPVQLVECLRRPEEVVCERAGRALVEVANSWPDDDVRQTNLVTQIAENFADFSSAGQQWALDFVAERVRSGHPAALSAARSLIACGLQSTEATIRIRVVRLATQSEISQIEPLLPLLRDAAPEVRQATILAIGPARSLVPDDDLLPSLHDPDADVQRLTKTALLSRGLTERQVNMGRLLSSANPAERLKLLVILQDEPELDSFAWLSRLSHDPCPAVRAAVARSASEQKIVRMTERLTQMAANDPDASVRPIARYYSQRMQSVRQASAP